MTPQLITRFGLFVTLLAFLIGGCQSALPTLPPGQQSQVSLLVNLDSSTQIKREGWKDYQPVGFGTLVHPTDLLKTNGNVTLLCADLQTVKTLTNEGRNPCPFLSNNIVLQYDDMLFSPGVRGNTATTIPILISPRNTAILDAHPRLRWKDTGAASYIVEIRQGSKSVWTKKEVASTEITYPADAPMLEAGKDYLLVITDPATGRSSSEDSEKGLGFQVVSDTQRSEIEVRRQSILQLSGLDEPSKKLALAIYYANLRIGGRGLLSDARILLEEVAQAKPNEPAVFLRLGDVLAKMKLWDEAENSYKNALAQAEKLQDLETQANALVALWRINPADQAKFDQALRIYEQIGAKDQSEQLRKEFMP
jgi:hypothetical protein